MSQLEDLEYTPTHEWVRLEGANAVIGVTDRHPIISAELQSLYLPKVGQSLKTGQTIVVAKTARGVEEIRTPVSGTIAEVNEEATPDLVRQDPFGRGWLVRLQVEAGEEIEHLEEPGVYEAHNRADPAANI